MNVKALKILIRECIKEIADEDNIIRGVDFKHGTHNTPSKSTTHDKRYEMWYGIGANAAIEGVGRDENPCNNLKDLKAWDDGWNVSHRLDV